MKEEAISNGIYTAVKPYHFMGRMFGQVTYSYSKAKNNKRTTVRGSFHTVYSIVWAIFYIMALACTLRLLHNCDSEVLPEIITSDIYYITAYGVSIVSLVHGAIFSGRKDSVILTKLSLVDSTLLRPQEEKRLNRKTMFTSIAEIVISLMIHVPMSFYYISLNAQETCLSTVPLSLECVINYCNIMIVLRYCNLVRVLQERYKYINKYLSSYVNVSCTINCVTNRNRARGHSRYFGEGNEINLCVLSRNSRSITAIELRSLRIIFSEINYAVRLINEEYGISVLVATIWLLVSVVLMVFFTLLDAEYGGYTGIGYLASCLCLLIMLAFACNAAGSENDVSKFLVHKLLLDNTLHPKVIEELKMLALQLNSTTTEYSAYGFFALNLPFLCSVTGVIVSYIVIIVQIK
jgi:hypothetical protein